MTLDEWLGRDNQIGKDIWANKYQFENETFDNWVNRVSGNNKDIAELIKHKKFLFGGRILQIEALRIKVEKSVFLIVM